MPLMKEVRLLAAAIEDTSGTLQSLSGANATWNAYNVEAQPNITMHQRKMPGYFDTLPAIPGAKAGTIKFSIDLTGGASDPAWASVLLPACGFVVSGGTYSPKTEAPGSNVKTVTIATYQGGRMKKLRGAAGSLVMNFESGLPVRGDFTFIGAWVDVEDEAILSPTLDTTKPPRFAGATLTIASYAPKVAKLTIDLGNQLYLRPDPTADTAIAAACVSDRLVTGTLDPESELVATQDSYGQWLSSTEQALSVIWGSSGNRITLAAPKLQFVNLQEGERSGLEVDTVSFQLNGSSGNDSFTLAFD